MAAYTRENLVDRILVRLGEVGFGQSAEPEARKRVTDPLDGILDELETDGVIEFACADEIPGAAMDPLSVVIASKLSDDFGLPPDAVTLIATRAVPAQDKLRRFRWRSYGTFLPRRGQYF